MKLKFTKMQGVGNDFVVIDGFETQFDPTPEKVKRLCDRHFGVGADQLLILKPSTKAQFQMLVYNQDGGQVEMCGNGIRCAARFMRERRGMKANSMEVETLAGIMRPSFQDSRIKVDMGEPKFDAETLPSIFSGEVM